MKFNDCNQNREFYFRCRFRESAVLYVCVYFVYKLLWVYVHNHTLTDTRDCDFLLIFFTNPKHCCHRYSCLCVWEKATECCSIVHPEVTLWILEWHTIFCCVFDYNIWYPQICCVVCHSLEVYHNVDVKYRRTHCRSSLPPCGNTLRAETMKVNWTIRWVLF